MSARAIGAGRVGKGKGGLSGAALVRSPAVRGRVRPVSNRLRNPCFYSGPAAGTTAGAAWAGCAAQARFRDQVTGRPLFSGPHLSPPGLRWQNALPPARTGGSGKRMGR
ncbi:hypothetical protein MOX02_43870 [Methylobacterium oxalidis]|uniref:Uncharacterized protein n=1 Tax=Methylobacterium oxalidis TaxID=944322 RepID=A0A512J917_9HYPH|nr:hypothetical protein MOX02_43870 [Methylobacterium oxalidis]GLS62458.1 hypothetical protein GCM10007888_08390 [Methylobacterium oxalidis]